MLLKKIDRSRLFLEKQQGLFTCPQCGSNFKVVGTSFICEKNHRFDLNKKGSLHFLNHTVKTEYDKEMLTHRQNMIQGGLYQPLIEWLVTYLAEDQVSSVVDMGCGEGSFLQQLEKNGLPGNKIGFDISKDGVALATNQELEAFWCVADITNLPFGNQQISHLLNIFSPSHYQEFRRVLAPQGKLVKVVPESGYLKELRELFYQDQAEKQSYSNEKVVTKFAEEMAILKEHRLTYKVPVTAANYQDVLEMTPLKWGASLDKRQELLRDQKMTYLTIDVLILVGQSS